MIVISCFFFSFHLYRGCLRNLAALCFPNESVRDLREKERMNICVEMTEDVGLYKEEIEAHLRQKGCEHDDDVEMAVEAVTKGTLYGRGRGDKELANRGVEFVTDW